MQPPKCKSCGKAEWNHLCCPARNRNLNEESLAETIAQIKAVKPAVKVAIKPTMAVVDEPVDGDKSDRAAYRREWMKKKREVEKAQKPSKPRGRPKKGELVAPLAD